LFLLFFIWPWMERTAVRGADRPADQEVLQPARGPYHDVAALLLEGGQVALHLAPADQQQLREAGGGVDLEELGQYLGYLPGQLLSRRSQGWRRARDLPWSVRSPAPPPPAA
jgi:hypothetical protein